MPRYEVTGPDGRKFEVNTPQPVSDEELYSYIEQEHYSRPKETFIDAPKQDLDSSIFDVPVALGRGAVQGCTENEGQGWRKPRPGHPGRRAGPLCARTGRHHSTLLEDMT